MRTPHGSACACAATDGGAAGGRCTEVPATAAPEAFDPKGKKIGYIYLTLAHPYYQAHSKQVQEYAKELGIELVERDGKIDAAVQTAAMEDLIAQKVDGIVFALIDPAASVPVIQEAQKAGIPVVTFAIRHGERRMCRLWESRRGLRRRRRGRKRRRDSTRSLARIPRRTSRQWNVRRTQAAVDRADGFIKGFTGADPKAKVITRADGGCVRDKALAATEDLLQAHPEVNVVYGAMVIRRWVHWRRCRAWAAGR